MKRPLSKLAIAVVAAFFLSACATSYQPVPAFTPVGVDAGGRALKTQNALFILDASSSMGEAVQAYKKFDVATSLLKNMGRTMPEGIGITSGLRSFGHDASVSSALTMLGDDMGAFKRADLEAALAAISKPGGNSPLGQAITAAGGDLEGLGGKSALIIVSDGKSMGYAPIAAAKALKEKMGGALCIYPIVVGDDPAGIKLMDELAAIGGCGFATSWDQLSSGAQMADFVTTVFIGADIDSDNDGVADMLDKCPGTPAGVKVDSVGCPLDSDRDGVPDYLDKCPGTPAGVKVDQSGCPITVLSTTSDTWTFNDINFEVNKAVITPSSYGILNEIVAALKARPDLNVRVEGHTDSTGAHAYNMDLSDRRAQAVVKYLVDRGIAPERLVSQGFGPDRPIADNATKEGRAKNRRVQFTRIK